VREGGARPQDAAVLLVIAGAVGVLVVARNASAWLCTLAGAVSGVLADPLAVALAVLLVGVVVSLAVVRVVVTRRLLADRVSVAVLAVESFDPTPEAVVAFAAGLGRVRRSRLGWLAPAACGVRVRLQSLPGGRMLYLLEAPRSALGVIRAAVAVYDGVELRDPATLNVTDGALDEEQDGPAGDIAGERSTVMDEDRDG